MRARSSTAPFLEDLENGGMQLTPRSRRSATFSMASNKRFLQISDYSMDSSNNENSKQIGQAHGMAIQQPISPFRKKKTQQKSFSPQIVSISN